MAKASENIFPKLQFSEETAPGTPSADQAVIYVKADGKLYLKDDAGTETDLTATGGGGGSGALTLIDTQTPASGAITFTSIPNTYRALYVVGRLRSDRANVVDAGIVQFGGATLDTGSNYRYESDRQGDSTSSVQSNGDTSLHFGDSNVPAGSADADASSHFEFTVYRYADTTAYRSVHGFASGYSSSTVFRRTWHLGQWMDTTDAVEQIKVASATGSNLVAPSELSLYGMAAS